MSSSSSPSPPPPWVILGRVVRLRTGEATPFSIPVALPPRVTVLGDADDEEEPGADADDKEEPGADADDEASLPVPVPEQPRAPASLTARSDTPGDAVVDSADADEAGFPIPVPEHPPATAPLTARSDAVEGSVEARPRSIPVALPPRLALPAAPPTVHTVSSNMYGYIVAAGPCCLLVVELPEDGRVPTTLGSSLLVLRQFLKAGVQQGHATTGPAHRLPNREGHMPGFGVDRIGLLSYSGGDYSISELVIEEPRQRARLLCIRAGGSRWFETEMDNPLPAGDRQWVPNGVVSVNHTLYWFDLSWGVLSCNPFDTEPKLLFERLPDGRDLDMSSLEIRNCRCIAVSCHGLRYVEIIPNGAGAMIILWTWKPQASGWHRTYKMRLEELWNSISYKKTRLPQKIPFLLLVCPLNPEMLYFSLENYIIGVNLIAPDVIHFAFDCYTYDELTDFAPICCRFLPWCLPPAVSQGLSELLHRKKRGLTCLEESKGFSELLLAKKRKSAPNLEASEPGSKQAIDVFSLLPNDLLWSFISYLPIHEAAKAAILSKQLLSAWRSYPYLSFTLGKNPNMDMLNSVGSILEKHDQRSVQSFFVDGFLQNVNEELIHWLQVLETKFSKNFSLELYSRAISQLLNSVFNMIWIYELRLHQCGIHPLQTQKITFPCLSKLSLKYCTFPEKSHNDLQRFLWGCPNTTEMELVNNNLPKTPAYSQVHINHLFLKGLSLEDEESYTTWTVCSKHLSYAKIKVASDLNPQLLEQVKDTERLSLSAMTILAPIAFQFDKLVDLTLDLFMDQSSMTSTFNLLDHAPHLEYFEIEFNDMGLWKEPELFWEEQQSHSFPLGLEVVHVKGFTGTDLSADFLKFIASRLSIQRIIVTLDPNIHVTGYENAIRVLDKLREEYPFLHLTVFGEEEESDDVI